MGTLYRKLIELKTKPPKSVKSWRSFLASSLFNAAKNHVRDSQYRERRSTPLEDSLEALVAAHEDLAGQGLEVRRAWGDLTTEQQELWGLLVEEKGKASKVARRMGKPERTVRRWIKKLEGVLRVMGLGK